jgi:RES domain-containing protein
VALVSAVPFRTILRLEVQRKELDVVPWSQVRLCCQVARRIAADTRQYRADDLSGGGAAKHPGRWNDAGEAVIYAARAISIAVLETAAHIDGAGLPLNRFLVELDVPDDVWAAREAIDVTALPPTWLAIPAGQASVRVGSQCLASLRSPILLVPSVIVPEGARCPGESQASGVRAHHGPGGAPVRVQPAFPVVA